MKYRSLFFVIFSFIITAVPYQIFSNSGPDSSESIRNFIIRYYNDLETADANVISKYFLKRVNKEELARIINICRIYKIDRIEFIETKIVSETPRIVEVVVKEWYKPEIFPPPYLETLFKLKEMDDLSWKIVEITEPGLP